MWPQFAILMLFMFLWAGFAGVHRRSRLRAWRSWTQRMGLTGTGKGAISYQFPAEHDGLQVSLQLKHSSDGDRTCLTVSMSSDDDAPAPEGVIAAITPSLSIHPRLLSARRGLECGDAAFNKALVVRGDEVLCAALFDHATRLTLQRCLARHDFVVENGKVSCTTRGILREAEVKSVANTLLEVARELRVSPASIPARLLSTARSDPEPRVRTRAIAALLVGFGDRPETADAIKTAGQGSVQELLLGYLEEEPRKQRVVFHALSKIGTLASVEHLLKLNGDSDTHYFRNVCVDAIQKRLGTGDQGWLSLAAPAADQGALSTAHEGSTLAIAKLEQD